MAAPPSPTHTLRVTHRHDLSEEKSARTPTMDVEVEAEVVQTQCAPCYGVPAATQSDPASPGTNHRQRHLVLRVRSPEISMQTVTGTQLQTAVIIIFDRATLYIPWLNLRTWPSSARSMSTECHTLKRSTAKSRNGRGYRWQAAYLAL